MTQIMTHKDSTRVPYKVLVVGHTTPPSTTPADFFKGFSFIQLRVSGRLGAEGSKKCGHRSSKVVAFQAKTSLVVVFVELGWVGLWRLRDSAKWSVLDMETLSKTLKAWMLWLCPGRKMPRTEVATPLFWRTAVRVGKLFLSPFDCIWERSFDHCLATRLKDSQYSVQYSHDDLAIIP